MTDKVRRICVYGGAGSGKSTLASWLASEVTIAGYDVQVSLEYVKKWVYTGKQPKSFDQVYLFSKQMYAEDSYLSSGVEIVVTDSPLLLSCSYAQHNGCPFANELISIAKKFDEQYPAINILLDRHNIPYKTKGRFQTYEEAVALDKSIEEFMKIHVPDYTKARTKDRQDILINILDKLA